MVKENKIKTALRNTAHEIKNQWKLHVLVFTLVAVSVVFIKLNWISIPSVIIGFILHWTVIFIDECRKI